MQTCLHLVLAAEGLERRQLGVRRGSGTEKGPARSVGDGQLVRLVAGVRAGGAEGRDRRHDQRRVLAREIVTREAELRSALRRDVVNQHVGLLEKRAESGAVFAATEVQRDTALVGVQIEEDAACLGIRLVGSKRAATTQRIALGGFYLDDVGTEVREHLPGERGRHSFAVLDDSKTLDCLSACGV